MKKMIGMAAALVLALAFSAHAADTTTKKVTGEVKTPSGTQDVSVTKTTTPEETKTVMKATGPNAKETITKEKTAGETTVTATKEMKKGPVAEDTVTFKKFETNGDYIYVMKDNKELRLKHTLSDSTKKNMLGLKEGTPITVTSTYPLTKADMAVVTDARVVQKAEAASQKVNTTVTTKQETTTKAK